MSCAQMQKSEKFANSLKNPENGMEIVGKFPHKHAISSENLLISKYPVNCTENARKTAKMSVKFRKRREI